MIHTEVSEDARARIDLAAKYGAMGASLRATKPG